MSVKDKKSELFSYFKKAKGEFLAGSHTISSNKGIFNTLWHLRQCKCVHVSMSGGTFFKMGGHKCTSKKPQKIFVV